METRAITEKENLLRAIHGNAMPQWVPFCNNCIHTMVPEPVRERPMWGASGKDWFGCEWIWDVQSMGFAPELRKAPILDDITDWRSVIKFPDLDAIDWEAAAARDLAGVDRENKLLRIINESGPFERIQAFIGFEEAFIAMYEEPETFVELAEAITDYKVKLIDLTCKYYKPDEIMFQDDLGSSTGPLISPDMYRQLLKPCHKRIADAIRSHGVIYTHHSCGCMAAFIDDLLDIGVQMINPIQPMNDWAVLAEKYKDALCFEVGTESVANYASSTEAEIRQNVKTIIDTFAPHGRCMLTCVISNADCAKNFDIVRDEAESYGGSFYSK